MIPPPSPNLRVLIVDDSEVVRIGLHTLLGTEKTITLVGQAHNVASAVEAATKLQPDVVLLDMRLPDGTGVDACRRILQCCAQTRVLVLTSVADEHMVDEAIRAGAHGYLLKEVHRGALVKAIHDVAEGKSILDPTLASQLVALVRSHHFDAKSGLATLSPQERKILTLIVEGQTNKEIGTQLGLAEKTVKNYLSTVFEKLHVSRRSQAAALYARETSGPERK